MSATRTLSRKLWSLAPLLALVFAPALAAAPRQDAPAAAGAAQDGAAAADSAAPQGAGARAGQKPPVADLDPLPTEPPAGDWLVDEGGREYFVWPLSKDEPWSRIGDGRQIRYRTWERYDVDSEDDEFLYVRLYRPVATEPRSPKPTAEQIAALDATFATTTPTSDRLRFVPFDSGLPRSGQWRNGFAVADLNGDGFLDIFHGQPRKQGTSGPVIFLGDGTGHWTLWRQAQFPPGFYSYGDVAVADFTGDGIADVALGMHMQGLIVLKGDGKGKFTRWSEGIDYEVPGRGGDAGGFSSRTIVAADWDGDGKTDLLALGEGPRPAREGKAKKFGLLPSSTFGLAVYLNQGDGTWRRYDQGVDGGLFGDSLAVGDFNADGRLDAVAASNTFNRGDIVHLGRAGEVGWTQQRPDTLRDRGYVRAVTTDDLDGDGRDDLVVAYLAQLPDATWWHGIDALYSRAGGTWERRGISAEKSRQSIFAVAAGDLDGDGVRDVVALTDSGETQVYLGDGKGHFSREQAPGIVPLPGGCRGYHAVLTDIDGDGRDELVESFAGEPSALFAPDQCPSRGGLLAWKAEPATR